MNIQSIIGPVDVYSAAVAIGLGIAITIMVTTALARTPRRKLDMDFKLAQMKQEFEHQQASQNIDVSRERELAKIASSREIEFKRIDNGMIDVTKTVSRDG